MTPLRADSRERLSVDRSGVFFLDVPPRIASAMFAPCAGAGDVDFFGAYA